DAAVEKVEQLLLSKGNQLSDTEKKVIEITILREPPMTDDEAAKEIGTTPGSVKVRRCSALRNPHRNTTRSCPDAPGTVAVSILEPRLVSIKPSQTSPPFSTVSFGFRATPRLDVFCPVSSSGAH